MLKSMNEIFSDTYRFGWLNFMDCGKLAGLMIALMIAYNLMRRKEEETFHFYSILMAVLCACPFTAYFLMIYQTRFYDYVWLWCLVPVIMFIAYEVTMYYSAVAGYMKDRKWYSKAAAYIVPVIIILLCSNMGILKFNAEDNYRAKEHAREVIGQIKDFRVEDENGIMLWAPDEIEFNVRLIDSDIAIPYGRNITNESLNAFTYDTYSEDAVKLHNWMVEMDKRARNVSIGEEIVSDVEAVNIAESMGVNMILFPSNIPDEFIAWLAAEKNFKPIRINSYYLFLL